MMNLLKRFLKNESGAAALKPETRALLLKVGVAVLTNGLLKRGLRKLRLWEF